MDERGFGEYGCLVILVVVLAILAAIAIPSFMRYSMRAKQSEATNNLAAIRTCQEAYFSEKGVYLECKSSPPEGGTDSDPDPWVDAGGFTEIGFMPDGNVRYQYAVTVSDDGQSFVATAMGDLDEDGVQTVFTVDREAEIYPRPTKTGDDY